MTLHSINRMIANPKEARSIRARRRNLKIVSNHVHEKYNDIVGDQEVLEEMEGQIGDVVS